MPQSFHMTSPCHGPSAPCAPAFLTLQQAEAARRYHATFPMYKPTPLVTLPDTAAALGLGSVCVKDESHRFGLNAFKVLGGSYAIGRCLADRMALPMDQVSHALLTSPAVHRCLGEITFITATDGNHGRGVAWTAAQLGMKSVVYMPKGSAMERLENIRAAGAQAMITDVNYDDTVRLAAAHAAENGWVLLQDTSWPGYEDIPRWIMQGYCTMGLEALEQLHERPTHIFLQAGVGAMAGAIAGLMAAAYGPQRPKVIIVEPNGADCLYRTARAADGQLHCVTGDLNTIMAGLACGEPCSVAWDVLAHCADHFISCPDAAAALGMRMLASPAGGDARIISGESGAAAFGCCAEIMLNPALAHLKEALALDASSRVLFFSTEGDTDRQHYREIVWGGKHPFNW